MRNRKTFFVTAVIICIFLFLNPVLSKEPQKPALLKKEDIYNQLELFADAITIINENYVEETDPKDLIHGSLKGMLNSLDAHSDFLTPDKYEEIKIDTGGEFGGLGIEITVEDNLLTIVTPLEDTPAHKAGLMPGDKIIKINGEPTKDFNLDDAVKKMRGDPGTEVTLTIMREKEERLKDYTIKRALIRIESVKEALMLDDVGYIRITDFQQKTSQDLEKALRNLEKEKASGLILDLRNNPGGLLDASIEVSEKFLPKDAVIVSIKGRVKTQQEEVYKSKGRNPRLEIPLVVLVNKGSASASEIVAAAIKDNKRGIIMGTPTFGKGSVQTVIPMRDGSAIRLTTSKYYTPAGEQIHDIGVTPHVLIEKIDRAAEEEKPQDVFKQLESDKERLRVEKLKQDSYIKSAIELLKGINVYKEFNVKNET